MIKILPVPLKSNVNIIGAGSNNTTLHSDVISTTNLTVFWGGDKNRNVNINGFKISSSLSVGNYPISVGNKVHGIHISDIVMEDIFVYHRGAVLFMEWESSTFDSLVIRNITTPESVFQINEVHSGLIRNSIFENIHSTYTSPETPGDDSWGGSIVNIWVVDSLSVENCTFRNISVQNNQPTFHITHLYNHIPMEEPNVSINNCLFENIRTNGVSSIGFHTNRYGEYQVSNCTFLRKLWSCSSSGCLWKSGYAQQYLL